MDGNSAARALALSHRGAVQAPAGCGKTWMIATAVAQHASGRQLVLTHTHAGVDALRRKLRAHGVSRRQYELETIAGWALEVSVAYPETTGLVNRLPRDSKDYESIYCGVEKLLRLSPIRRILRASYAGVFIDEY